MKPAQEIMDMVRTEQLKAEIGGILLVMGMAQLLLDQTRQDLETINRRLDNVEE